MRGASGLTCSIGIGTCKVVAKVASDRRKPGGIVVVAPGGEAAFLAPFDVRVLPGVGPRAEARLRSAGVTSVGDLAALADGDLARLLPGSIGALLRDRARGVDPRRLEFGVENISISQEETFARDVDDRARSTTSYGGWPSGSRRSCGAEARRPGRSRRSCATRTSPSRTRSQSLPVGTDDAERIGELACTLLDRALDDRPGALRLVGVTVSNLESGVQLALVGEAAAS